MDNPHSIYTWCDPTTWKSFRMIPTEPYQKLLHMRLTGAEFQIVLAIIDRTLGFRGRKSAFISYGLFQRLTGLSRPSVNIAIKSLEVKKIIVVNREARRNEYMWNQYWDTWKGNERNTTSSCDNPDTDEE